MNASKLIQFFESRQQRQQPLVLATVYQTVGSTYSKAGARMLIDADGIFQGMLSGGCLEGDLAIRAQVVIESREPQSVSYDLGGGDDELWGLGVGCDGVIRVFLQPLDANTNYEPFDSIAALLFGGERAMVVTVLDSESPAVSPGSALLVTESNTRCFGMASELADSLIDKANDLLRAVESCTETIKIAERDVKILYSLIEPMPRLLILGAGLDAEPVLRFGCELGWRCTVVDHRPAYIENGDFAAAERTICCAEGELETTVECNDFDLAIVMSHHLASDRSYLLALAPSTIDYIGLLGPAARRDRLLAELGDAADRLQYRLHGPAGLDLGGRGPAAIALSMVAQMQTVLSAR